MLRCSKNEFIVKLNKVQLVLDLDEFIISVSAFNQQFGSSLVMNPSCGYLKCNKVGMKLTNIDLRYKIYYFRGRILHRDESNASLMCFTLPKNARKISTNIFMYSDVGERNNNDNSAGKNDNLNDREQLMCLKVVGSRSSRRNVKRKLSPKMLELLQKEGELWHRRMGHISYPVLNKLKSGW